MERRQFVETSMADYIVRLKQYKSFMKKFRKTNKVPRWQKEKFPISRGRPMYTYMALCGDMSLTYHPGSGLERHIKRQFDLIDRAIIYNVLVLAVSSRNARMKICCRVQSDTHPLMPLNEYIHYLEDGILCGTFTPDTTVRLTLNGDDENICEQAITACTVDLDTFKYPLLHTSYSQCYFRPISYDDRNRFFDNMCELRDNILEERNRRFPNRGYRPPQ